MDDYLELEFKMDKYMPEDETLQREYYGIIDSEDLYEKKVKDLKAFFMENADMSILNNYMPEGGTLDDFITFLLTQDIL
jgi:hypothetical protein